MTFDLLPQMVTVFMLLFMRIGTLFMLLPGLGDRVFPVQVRLIMALAVSVILYPFLQPKLEAMVASGVSLAFIFGFEFLLGVLLGLSLRIVTSCLQTAGSMIAFQIGMGFVMALDPDQEQQGVLLGNFLTVFGVAMVFALDIHHLMLMAIVRSYEMFSVVDAFSAAEAGEYILSRVALSYTLAIQIAAPFLAFALVFNGGLGLIARLMPQLQIFHIGLPLSIFIGFTLFVVTIGLIGDIYAENLVDSLSIFTGEGVDG